MGVWSLLLAVAVGCADSGTEDPAPIDPLSVVLVPVEGRVTVDGKPLETAVVTFLPTDGPGSSMGETDAEGRYALETFGRSGAPVGRAKVSVSYLVSADGEPQGLGPRSAMSQPPGMLSATERIVPEHSDLGRTALTVDVSPQGGTFDFEVKLKEAPASSPTPPTEAPAETPAGE